MAAALVQAPDLVHALKHIPGLSFEHECVEAVDRWFRYGVAQLLQRQGQGHVPACFLRLLPEEESDESGAAAAPDNTAAAVAVAAAAAEEFRVVPLLPFVLGPIAGLVPKSVLAPTASRPRCLVLTTSARTRDKFGLAMCGHPLVRKASMSDKDASSGSQSLIVRHNIMGLTDFEARAQPKMFVLDTDQAQPEKVREADIVLVNVRGVKEFIDANTASERCYELVPPSLLPLALVDIVIVDGAHRIDADYLRELEEEARAQNPQMFIVHVVAGCNDEAKVADRIPDDQPPTGFHFGEQQFNRVVICPAQVAQALIAEAEARADAQAEDQAEDQDEAQAQMQQ